jgi:receptor protein-tyrosine kinase
MAFASAGIRTVLVDLDLRHPNAHVLVGGHNEFGAADVLLGRRSLSDVMQYVELPGYPGRTQPGLYLLATGGPVASPTELLGSGRTARLLEGLAAQADLVLVDSPPALPVADTLVVGRIASGAVLVTEARATAITAVQKAKDLLVQNQTRLLGVVLNKFQARDVSAGYGYGYGYGTGHQPADEGAQVVSSNGSRPPAFEEDDEDL